MPFTCSCQLSISNVIQMISPVNLAYYEKKDWGYLLSIIDDREIMPEEWDDWFKQYTKLKAQLIAKGFFVREITINVSELIEYCNERKIKINGEARARFVQLKQV